MVALGPKKGRVASRGRRGGSLRPAYLWEAHSRAWAVRMHHRQLAVGSAYTYILGLGHPTAL